MDDTAFRTFCAQLEGLAGTQLPELLAALKSLDAGADGRAAVELRRDDAGACPHCGHDRLDRWGRTRAGFQRRRRRTCQRRFSSTSGTALAGLHAPDRFHRLLVDMFSDTPRSCRRLAAELGLDNMTVWRWRHRVPRSRRGSGPRRFSGIVEVDETFVRESRKGSREWVNQERRPGRFPKPDRLRRADYGRRGLPLPARLSKHHLGVLAIADRTGGSRADVVPDRNAASVISILQRHLAQDVALVSDGDPAWRLFAQQNALPRHRLDAKAGPRVIDKAFHIQTINSLHARFKRVLKPFRGPASKTLPGDVACFVARVDGPEPQRVETARDRLMAA